MARPALNRRIRRRGIFGAFGVRVNCNRSSSGYKFRVAVSGRFYGLESLPGLDGGEPRAATLVTRDAPPGRSSRMRSFSCAIGGSRGSETHPSSAQRLGELFSFLRSSNGDRTSRKCLTSDEKADSRLRAPRNFFIPLLSFYCFYFFMPFFPPFEHTFCFFFPRLFVSFFFFG